MRREPTRTEGVYKRLVTEMGQRPCEHVPACKPGTPPARCPQPRALLVLLLAGEPVELAVWRLPGRPVDYGLGPYDTVRVSADDQIEVIRRAR